MTLGICIYLEHKFHCVSRKAFPKFYFNFRDAFQLILFYHFHFNISPTISLDFYYFLTPVGAPRWKLLHWLEIIKFEERISDLSAPSKRAVCNDDWFNYLRSKLKKNYVTVLLRAPIHVRLINPLSLFNPFQFFLPSIFETIRLTINHDQIWFSLHHCLSLVFHILVLQTPTFVLSFSRKLIPFRFNKSQNDKLSTGTLTMYVSSRVPKKYFKL